MACIYEIRNNVNGVAYIGSTNNYTKRKWHHINALTNNRHGNKYLQNAWNKYSKAKFTFKILEEVADDLQFDREQEYIDELLSNGCPIYNMCVDVYSPHKRKPIDMICQECNIDFISVYRNQKYCQPCSIQKAEWYFEKVIKPKRFKAIDEMNLYRRMHGQDEIEYEDECDEANFVGMLDCHDILDIYGIEGFQNGAAREFFHSDDDFQRAYEEALEVWG